MKKLTICVLLLSFTFQSVFACDLCGCNSGNYFIGPLPQFTTHFASLRYSFQRYRTTLRSDNSQFSNNHYQTAQLMLGTRIKNKWQLLAFIPYTKSELASDDGTKQNQGLGDITLNCNYNNLDKLALNKDTNWFNNEKVADTGGHSLFSGAGLELQYKRLAVGCNFQAPLTSELSSGQTHAKARGMCHVSLLF